MIEFTADCGHVIKADKTQAGTIVQCAYCGREAEVPRPADPDFLFEEVDLDELARTEGSTPLKQAAAEPATVTAEAEAAPPASPRTVLAASGTIVGLIVLIAVGYVIVDSASTDTGRAQDAPTVEGSTLTGTLDDPANTTTDESPRQTAEREPADPDARTIATTPPRGANASRPVRDTTPDDPAPTQDDTLVAEATRLTALLDTGIVVGPNEWRRYLVGGADYTTWLQAEPASRVALIKALPPDLARGLAQPLGLTLLQDDTLAVRLALLDALVAGKAPTALGYIQQRLDALAADTRMTAVERQTEQAALQNARRQLAPPTPRKRNPWDR